MAKLKLKKVKLEGHWPNNTQVGFLNFDSTIPAELVTIPNSESWVKLPEEATISSTVKVSSHTTAKKTSGLRKLINCLRPFFFSVWSLRWIAKPVGYLLPRDDREEWLGDVDEIHHLMLIKDKYPIWLINLIIATKTLLLIWSAIKVHIDELLE